MLRPGKIKGKKKGPKPPVQLLVWRGDPASHLTLRLLQKAAQKLKSGDEGPEQSAGVILLAAFKEPAGQVLPVALPVPCVCLRCRWVSACSRAGGCAAGTACARCVSLPCSPPAAHCV